MNLPLAFRPAIEASKFSDHPQHRMGAAVYYRGKFLAAGFNQQKTHPLMNRYNQYKKLHAELHALVKAKAKKFDLDDLTIFIYRATKEGEIAMAKPCEACMEILPLFGVKNVNYTHSNGWEKLRL